MKQSQSRRSIPVVISTLIILVACIACTAFCTFVAFRASGQAFVVWVVIGCIVLFCGMHEAYHVWWGIIVIRARISRDLPQQLLYKPDNGRLVLGILLILFGVRALILFSILGALILLFAMNSIVFDKNNATATKKYGVLFPIFSKSVSLANWTGVTLQKSQRRRSTKYKIYLTSGADRYEIDELPADECLREAQTIAQFLALPLNVL